MKNDFDKEGLLNDVFEDAAGPDFRAGLLGKTLAEVARRKRARHRIRSLSVLAALAIMFAFGARFLRSPRAPAPSRPHPLVVHSELLGPNMIVATRFGTIDEIRSSGSSFALLSTSEAGRTFELINDTQLLALLGDRPAALLYRGPAQAELVFVHPSDAQGFPVQ